MLVFKIFGFLEEPRNDWQSPIRGNDRTIILTERVCKSWQNNEALDEIREKASFRLCRRIIDHHNGLSEEAHYPKTITRIFQSSCLSIARLPKLDFGDRMGSTDYINFLKPEDIVL